MSGERGHRFEDRGFRGMVDNLAHFPGPGIVRRAINFYLDDGVYRARPGTVQLGTGQLASGARVQALPSYKLRATGERHRLAIAGGKLFEYSYGPGTWAEISLGGGAALSASPLSVAWCVFNDHLVVTDGINKPWSWDGSTFTVLADAPVARRCTVYYLKLFFGDIIGKPTSLMWSEEADETIGYLGPKAGGGTHDNEWVFGQTDAGRILQIVGLNEALVVFKENSVAAIRGPVEEQFQTTGVREGIDDKLGIVAPESAIVRGQTVSYLTTAGPKEVRSAVGPPVDLDRDRLVDTWSDFRRADWSKSIGVFDPVRRHDLWILPRLTTDPDYVVAYSSEPAARLEIEDQGFSYFDGWTASAFGVYEDDQGNQQVVFGDPAGRVYHYGPQSVWDDAGATVRRVLRKEGYGGELEGERNYDRLDFLFRIRGNAEITVRPITDGRAGTGRLATIGTGQFPLWNVSKWNLAKWGPAGGELVSYSRGLNEEGRACGWEVVQEQMGGAIDVVAARMLATEAHAYPA